MGLKIKLWGIRGSLPAPHLAKDLRERIASLLTQYECGRAQHHNSPTDFLKTLKPFEVSGYGGHTSCVEVRSSKERLVIDAGSGLRCLGDELIRDGTGLGRARIHILMTHFHWDHIVGLPFFTPIFIAGNEINFYAVQEDMEENIKRMFCKPNFPVSFDKLPSTILFHKLEPRKAITFQDITVTPYELDHPDPCWGYRIESKGKVYAHCVDTECRRVTREDLGADLPLYQNVDLMLFDAQYTFHEAAERINWGHSSGPIGIDIALREKIKKVLFVHHDPSATDAKIALAEMQTREYYDSARKIPLSQGEKPHNIDWCFAYESMEIEL